MLTLSSRPRVADIRLSRRALEDLRHIDRYLRERNPKTARDLAASFQKSFSLLADFPELGRADDYGLGRVYVVPRYKYLVFYRLRGDEVHVLYILHPRQDRRDP